MKNTDKDPELKEKIDFCIQDYRKQFKKYPTAIVVEQDTFDSLKDNGLLKEDWHTAQESYSDYILKHNGNAEIEIHHLERVKGRQRRKLETRVRVEKPLTLCRPKIFNWHKVCTYSLAQSPGLLSQM